MDIRNWKRFLPPKEDKKKWRTFICVAIGLKLIVKVALIASAMWIGQSMTKSASGMAPVQIISPGRISTCINRVLE